MQRVDGSQGVALARVEVLRAAAARDEVRCGAGCSVSKNRDGTAALQKFEIEPGLGEREDLRDRGEGKEGGWRGGPGGEDKTDREGRDGWVDGPTRDPQERVGGDEV
jgi:hypothetical protein